MRGFTRATAAAEFTRGTTAAEGCERASEVDERAATLLPPRSVRASPLLLLRCVPPPLLPSPPSPAPTLAASQLSLPRVLYP